MERRNSQATAAYSGSCEVVHADHTNYHTFKHNRSENRIMSSCFSAFEGEVRPRGLGVKFAASGQESYWLQGKRYSVSNGTYFLVNESVPLLDVSIKKAATWSVCVDIDARLVNEVLLQVLQPNELDSCHQTSRYLLSPDLFIREASGSARLQQLLTQLITRSATGQVERPAIEYIYELTALVVQESREVIGSYYSLQTAKTSTRKELFQRLLQGKDMLDDSIFSAISIKDVADACCLSEFRFYRLFKQCFGDSPYNYLIRQRIERSLQLKKQGYTWVDVAALLNFTDVAAFSKSFKKLKGVPPTKAEV